MRTLRQTDDWAACLPGAGWQPAPPPERSNRVSIRRRQALFDLALHASARDDLGGLRDAIRQRSVMRDRTSPTEQSFLSIASTGFVDLEQLDGLGVGAGPALAFPESLPTSRLSSWRERAGGRPANKLAPRFSGEAGFCQASRKNRRMVVYLTRRETLLMRKGILSPLGGPDLHAAGIPGHASRVVTGIRRESRRDICSHPHQPVRQLVAGGRSTLE